MSGYLVEIAVLVFDQRSADKVEEGGALNLLVYVGFGSFVSDTI